MFQKELKHKSSYSSKRSKSQEMSEEIKSGKWPKNYNSFILKRSMCKLTIQDKHWQCKVLTKTDLIKPKEYSPMNDEHRIKDHSKDNQKSS